MSDLQHQIDWIARLVYHDTASWFSNLNPIEEVDGQLWDMDPWTVTERDGKFYGRSTADMKSLLAISPSLIPEMIAHGERRT